MSKMLTGIAKWVLGSFGKCIHVTWWSNQHYFDIYIIGKGPGWVNVRSNPPLQRTKTGKKTPHSYMVVNMYAKTENDSIRDKGETTPQTWHIQTLASVIRSKARLL